MAKGVDEALATTSTTLNSIRFADGVQLVQGDLAVLSNAIDHERANNELEKQLTRAGAALDVQRMQDELQGVKVELRGVKVELHGVEVKLQGVEDELQDVKDELRRAQEETQRVREAAANAVHRIGAQYADVGPERAKRQVKRQETQQGAEPTGAESPLFMSQSPMSPGAQTRVGESIILLNHSEADINQADRAMAAQSEERDFAWEAYEEHASKSSVDVAALTSSAFPTGELAAPPSFPSQSVAVTEACYETGECIVEVVTDGLQVAVTVGLSTIPKSSSSALSVPDAQKNRKRSMCKRGSSKAAPQTRAERRTALKRANSTRTPFTESAGQIPLAKTPEPLPASKVGSVYDLVPCRKPQKQEMPSSGLRHSSVLPAGIAASDTNTATEVDRRVPQCIHCTTGKLVCNGKMKCQSCKFDKCVYMLCTPAVCPGADCSMTHEGQFELGKQPGTKEWHILGKTIAFHELLERDQDRVDAIRKSLGLEILGRPGLSRKMERLLGKDHRRSRKPKAGN